eukprot:10249494-Alexandrium_andersonii.AAC.1
MVGARVLTRGPFCSFLKCGWPGGLGVVCFVCSSGKKLGGSCVVGAWVCGWGCGWHGCVCCGAG